jgi:hypothetical protein
METFTVIAFIWLGANHSPFHERRERRELECKHHEDADR